MARILIADDEQDIRDALRRVCMRDGHEVVTATNGRETVDLTRSSQPDLIVLDNRMPGLTGLEALARIREFDPNVVAVLYTAYDEPADVHRAVVELGAYGYLLKTAGGDAMRATIQQALRSRGFVLGHRKHEEAKPRRDELDFGGMLGRSQPMHHVFQLIRRIGHSDVTVLIQGESGTGKELVARALHEQGLRARGPYVTVDCGSLPDTLMESEIFGYEAGAFTDARRSKPGKVELADGGTLFLDEIGNLPLGAQAKLLRVIEDKRLSRLGDNTVREVDVRIIAATNLDLEVATRDRIFREDLYYRLNVFKLWLPPLRERREDVPFLVEHFVKHYAAQQGRMEPPSVSPEAMESLLARAWPGNVRELRNVIERAVLLADDGIGSADLTAEAPAGPRPRSGSPGGPAARPGASHSSGVAPMGNAGLANARLDPPAAPAAAPAGEDFLVLPPVDLDGVALKDAKHAAGDVVERAYILAALRRCHWNKAKAAKMLGLNYKTLREKIRSLDLDRLRYQEGG